MLIHGQPPALGRKGRRLARTAALAFAIAVATPAAATDEDGKDAPPEAAAELSVRRDQTRAELDAINSQINVSQDRIAKLRASVVSLGQDLASVRLSLVDTASRRRDLEEKLTAGEERLSNLRQRESEIRELLYARRGVLAEVLAALQRMGRNPPPALLVSPDDALSSIRSAILLGAVVPEMRAETEYLLANLTDLAETQKDIVAERAELKKTLTSSAEEKARLELLLEKKAMLQDLSRKQIAAERKAAAELAGKATNLQDLIGSLETEIASVREAADEARRAEEERRRQAVEALARAREKAADIVPDKNRIAPSVSFASLGGRLELPVAGEVARVFGDDDGTGHTLKGMMVSARPGALVTAPADGWVIYAGPFRSYGQLLILNPGDGFHLVLAGMDRINVSQGQFVVAGEPVAEMGNTKLAAAAALALVSDQPTLYIEFRKDGQPVDPRPWWSTSHSGRASNGT